MPGMNGRELAVQFQQVNPDVKTIFVSGYSDRILNNTSTLGARTPYLQKPFTLAQLAEVLRQVQER